MRRKWSWTTKQIDKLNKVQGVLSDLCKYKPLTLRQVYYQLVGCEYIENKNSEYVMLSKLLKNARNQGLISWDDIEDRVRVIERGEGWTDKIDFVGYELSRFLEGYRRHLVQDQDKFIEVWIEKDALRTIFSRLTSQYCISTVVCRGFSSASFLNDFRNRVLLAREHGQQPVMLYFGDFDPSGNEMLPAMRETLEEEMGLGGIEFRRIALTIDDIEKYNLPHNPKALKKKDTRAKKHVDQFGYLAVELDALHPRVLEEKIVDAIENELNMNNFDNQRIISYSEIDYLSKLKTEIQHLISDKI